MTLASINAGGDFRVGDVISRAWSILTRNIIFFLTVPILLLLSYVIIGVGVGFVFGGASGTVMIAGPRGPAGSPWTLGLAGIVVIIVAALLILCFNMIGQGVLLMGAFQRLRGQPLRPLEALQRVLTRILPLTGLSLLVGLALILVMLFASFVFAAIGRVLGGFALVLLPLVAVPPFFLIVMWLVAAPACVVEGLGGFSSMVRSAELTRGYRWKITGIVLLIFAVIVAERLIQLAVAVASPVLSVLVGLAWFVILIAYIDCVVIMTYHDLRVAKEGVDTSQIASIFD
ncbi:MAG TPA: hypothetical protein VKX28_15390 [Xanthobacteraceae bacterium]|jgi:hypothetical protein|nr:hypothetical protein [Xanthobacteraceae bacterium]